VNSVIKKTELSKSFRLIAGLVFLSGIAISIGFSTISKKRHEREVRRIFTAESESMRSSVKKQIDLFFDVLDSIGSLHELSTEISAEDFAEFSRTGLRFQENILGAYGLIQRVPDEIRSALEQDAANPLIIVAPDDGGGLSPSASRPEYFPLMFEKPAGSLGLPLGFDLLQMSGVAEAINSALARKGPSIVSTIRVQRSETEAGYWVLSPLFQKQDPVRDPVLSGFLVSILWPQTILERALADTSVRDVLVRFYDRSTQPRAESEASGSAKFIVVNTLAVADQTWVLETTASPEYLQARQTVLPGVILLSGGLITILLTMTIWQFSSRAREIEAVVNQRTRQLQESMQERMRLESEILEISDREKRQIGQDLHDSLGQKLTGAVFLSRALAEQPPHDEGSTRAQAIRINETLKEAVAQVRRMARGLSPIELGQDGLGGALQRLATEISDIYGISCLFHQADSTALPAGKNASHLYAITLEAVTNAIKHGGANEIVIELSAKESRHNS